MSLLQSDRECTDNLVSIFSLKARRNIWLWSEFGGALNCSKVFCRLLAPSISCSRQKYLASTRVPITVFTLSLHLGGTGRKSQSMFKKLGYLKNSSAWPNCRNHLWRYYVINICSPLISPPSPSSPFVVVVLFCAISGLFNI